MLPCYTTLSLEEAERCIGCYFTQRVGKYNQRVIVVEQVGRNGTCWYREVRTKVIARSPATILPSGEVLLPTKTLVAAEPLKGLPLSRGYLRYNEIPMMLGYSYRPIQVEGKKFASWEMTKKDTRYTVLEDSYNVFAHNRRW